MSDPLVQKASLISDGANNYTIQGGVWSSVGAIPTVYEDKVAFFEEHGFVSLSKSQLGQLKTQLIAGKGKFLTLAKIDASDVFGDGTGQIYYNFDNNVDDASGQYPITATAITYEPHGSGQALVLSNASRVTLNNPLSTFGSVFSISMHIKINLAASAQYPRLFDAWQSNTGVTVYITGGMVNVQIEGVTLNIPKPIVTNTWTHVAVTYDRGSLKVYLDGNFEASRIVPASFTLTPVAALGFTPPEIPPSLFVGSMDEFRFFSTELTQTQVTELANVVF